MSKLSFLEEGARSFVSALKPCAVFCIGLTALLAPEIAVIGLPGATEPVVFFIALGPSLLLAHFALSWLDSSSALSSESENTPSSSSLTRSC